MTLRRTSKGLSVLLITACFVGAAAVSQVAIVAPSGRQELSVSDLVSLPQVEVTVSDHGKPAQFVGVELHTLLERVGMPKGTGIHGKELAQYVLIEANDGYRVVFAVAELSPAFSDRKVVSRQGVLLRS